MRETLQQLLNDPNLHVLIVAHFAVALLEIKHSKGQRGLPERELLLARRFQQLEPPSEEVKDKVQIFLRRAFYRTSPPVRQSKGARQLGHQNDVYPGTDSTALRAKQIVDRSEIETARC